jgi:hypothetical protein
VFGVRSANAAQATILDVRKLSMRYIARISNSGASNITCAMSAAVLCVRQMPGEGSVKDG